MGNLNYIAIFKINADLSKFSYQFLSTKKIRILIYLMLFFSTLSYAQEKNIKKQTETPITYEEILVSVFIDNVGSFDLNVLYSDKELVYIPIEDLFKPLQIAYKFDATKDIIDGFINLESNQYKVDFLPKKITIGTKIVTFQDELIKELGVIYLESSKFKEVFGIDLAFNFRSLSIKLKADFELPIVKQARIQKMQNNISKVKGDIIADTIINRSYHLFKFGTLDWNIAAYQNWNKSTTNIIGLGIGTELLFGEANISANFTNQYKFNNRQLNYHWRWIDNTKSIIKQAQIGKISAQSISSLTAPLIGATIRNAPTTIRKATGNYTINEFTEPNWKVELYINNVLVDFTTADAAGNYKFKVPIIYGYTTLKFKFYGPMGEERVEERVTNVPYTVMPTKEFEYGITAGVLQDSTNGKFGKGEFFYGLSRKLTIGGGIEYLSSITENKAIPFAKTTYQPFSKLTLNAEYAHGVRSRGLLNYYVSRDILLEIDYANYVEGQQATLFNASEELKAKLSVPFSYQKFNGYLKLDYSQLKYTSFNYNNANILLSANYKQLNANTSAQLNWINQQTPFMLNDFALSYRLKNNIIIRPSFKSNLMDQKLISYKAEVEKSSYIGHFTVSYEKNKLAKDHFINVSFKYDLPFARVNTVATHIKGNFTTSESAHGSIAFGGGNHYIHTSNNSSIGKGGLLLYPFLDINQNGIFDKGETLVKLSNVKIAGGRALYSKKDFIIRIPDLNAFTNYTLTFSDVDLENISWRFKHNTYEVLIDPNQFKRIDIPINIMGEISGMVSNKVQNTLKGAARISVKIYPKNSDEVVAETLSESDGYIYFLGLKPGDYSACIDKVQLENLKLTANPSCREFTIKPLIDGDIVEGINFELSVNDKNNQILIDKSSDNNKIELVDKNNVDALNIDLPKDAKKTQILVDKSSEKNKIELAKQEENKAVTFQNKYKPWALRNTNVNEEGEIVYIIQLMASRSPVNIHKYFSKLLYKIPTLQIIETHRADGWYRYQAGIFNTRAEAMNMVRKFKEAGWKEFYVAPYITIINQKKE